MCIYYGGFTVSAKIKESGGLTFKKPEEIPFLPVWKYGIEPYGTFHCDMPFKTEEKNVIPKFLFLFYYRKYHTEYHVENDCSNVKLKRIVEVLDLRKGDVIVVPDGSKYLFTEKKECHYFKDNKKIRDNNKHTNLK